MNKHPIKSLWDGDVLLYEVGKSDVQEIIAVVSRGDITWFKIYKRGNLVAMENASKVQTIIFQ